MTVRSDERGRDLYKSSLVNDSVMFSRARFSVCRTILYNSMTIKCFFYRWRSEIRGDCTSEGESRYV